MINTREPFIEYVNFAVELIDNRLHTEVKLSSSISAVDLSRIDTLTQFDGKTLSIFHMTKYVTEITGIPRSKTLNSFFNFFYFWINLKQLLPKHQLFCVIGYTLTFSLM